MKSHFIVIFFLYLFNIELLLSQDIFIGNPANIISPNQIDSTTNKYESYTGVYHFGDSECESSLLILITNDKVYSQLRYGNWDNTGDNLKWIFEYINLKNPKIEKTKFITPIGHLAFPY